jgi:hypothetical protein
VSTARLASIAVALACLAFGGWLAVGSRDERRLEQARSELAAGRPALALSKTGGVAGAARGRAIVVRAYAETARGRYAPRVSRRAVARSEQLAARTRRRRRAARARPPAAGGPGDAARARAQPAARAAARVRRAVAVHLPPGFALRWR